MEGTLERVTESTPTVDLFLKKYFPSSQPTELDSAEEAVVQGCLSVVAERFIAQKYILGLVIDFAVIAQQLSDVDTAAKVFQPDLTHIKIFERYELTLQRAGKEANTLTLKYGNKSFGIRKIEEEVGALYNALERPSYPSAYVYNTGMWNKPGNQDLLVNCFRLSQQARLVLCRRLIEYGMQHLPQNTFFVRPVQRVRLFEHIVSNYPRMKTQHENAGVIYQALAYGYAATQYPHLDRIADKVRTGSARQRRFGDIDCYQGLDLEVSIEVKDLQIDVHNMEKQLGNFIKSVNGADLVALAFLVGCTSEARVHLESQSIQVLTQVDLLEEIARWDWYKQNRAVQGMLHQLAHVEQSPNGVRRLLTFIAHLDPQYDALAFHSVDSESSELQ